MTVAPEGWLLQRQRWTRTAGSQGGRPGGGDSDPTAIARRRPWTALPAVPLGSTGAGMPAPVPPAGRTWVRVLFRRRPGRGQLAILSGGYLPCRVPRFGDCP